MKVSLGAGMIVCVHILLCGCFNATRTGHSPEQQKRTFIPVVAPAQVQATRFGAIKIRTVRVLPPFDSRAFIVRRSRGEFVGDFYNTWIAPPNDLIRTQIERFLGESRLFAAVYDATSGTLPPLGLEGVVSDLYLDFTPAKPEAVVTLRLVVLDERSSTFHVLFSAEKTARVPFDPSEKDAAALAVGSGLSQTLDSLIQCIAQADLPK